MDVIVSASTQAQKELLKQVDADADKTRKQLAHLIQKQILIEEDAASNARGLNELDAHLAEMNEKYSKKCNEVEKIRADIRSLINEIRNESFVILQFEQQKSRIESERKKWWSQLLPATQTINTFNSSLEKVVGNQQIELNHKVAQMKKMFSQLKQCDIKVEADN